MMHPNDIKQDRQSVTPEPSDILSYLPENVIDVVLMSLPLIDAVRTSILSKKWRFNWCRLSRLTLDYQTLSPTGKGQLSPEVKLTHIVDSLLTLHAGPITKFALFTYCMENCPNIDDLIFFLSRNGIQHLDLHFRSGNPYRLPFSFFTCLQMKHLTLYYCLIHPPSNFKGFDRLISLELQYVTMSSKLLESFISHCPLLEQLVLHISDMLEPIKINAPKLRSFDFIGNRNSICLKNCPLLVKLSLVDTGSSEHTGRCYGAEFFDSFPALEHLHLCYPYNEYLAAVASELPTKLPSALKCLKHLRLSNICVGDFVDASCVLCLIRSSPHLQDIEFEVFHGAIPVRQNLSLEVLQAEALSDVTLNQLRSVKLTAFTGTEAEMELIKLLLAKSPVLERMLIGPELGDDSSEEAIGILTKLTRFRRASPLAEVVYALDDYYPYDGSD